MRPRLSSAALALASMTLFHLVLYFLPLSTRVKLLLYPVSLFAFAFFRIDARFFIVAAILHLWFTPFAIFGSRMPLAEASAFYALAYLAVGILGLLIQLRLPAELRAGEAVRELDWQIAGLLAMALSGLCLFILSFLTGHASLVAASQYLFTLSMAMFALAWIIDEDHRPAYHHAHDSGRGGHVGRHERHQGWPSQAHHVTRPAQQHAPHDARPAPRAHEPGHHHEFPELPHFHDHHKQ